MRVDKTVINELNRQEVLNVIRCNGSISRTDIAHMTGLSVPTVMKIVDSFIGMGLVCETGKRQSNGGKPPMLLEFVPDAYFCVGIDIGATKILGIMADCAGNIAYRYQIPNDSSYSDEEFLAHVADVIHDVLTNSGVARPQILGIGVGMPGLIRSSDSMVVFSPVLHRKDLRLYDYLAERFDLPLMVDSIHRALVFGEKKYGLCRNSENFVTVNLGYGIGAGLFINGSVYSGSSGFAVEIGHTILNPLGPRCFCGNRGCLETLGSALAMTRDAINRIRNNEQTMLTEMVSGKLEKLEAKHIFEAAKQGDSLACDIVSNAIDYIGMGIANLTNIMDPDYVVIEGGLSLSGDFLLKPLKEAWRKYRMNYSGRNTRIVLSEFGADATAIGASAMIFDLLMTKGYNPKKLLDGE